MSTNATRLLILLVFAFLSGCLGNPVRHKERTAKNINEIGVVHLSLGQPIELSDEFKKKLNPNFQMTGDSALAKSLPTSILAQRYFVENFLASLNAQGPAIINTDTLNSNQSNVNETKTILNNKQVTTEDGTKDLNTKEEVEQSTTKATTDIISQKGRAVGKASDAGLWSDDYDKGIKPSKLTTDLNTTLGVDPMLRLTNAFNLFVATQTLNSMIEKIKVPNDWKAFVVPVRVTLIPNGKNLPYDLRSTISFTGVKYSENSNVPDIVSTGLGVNGQAARVMLLGTDNNELLSMEGAEDFGRTLGLNAQLISGLTDLRLKGGSNTKAGTQFKGNNIHSIISAGQRSENSIHVSFGSSLTSDTTSEAIPRTYLLTLVVMVPKESDEIVAISSNKFMHTRTGEMVYMSARDTQIDNQQSIENILNQYIEPEEKVSLCQCGFLTADQDRCREVFKPEQTKTKSNDTEIDKKETELRAELKSDVLWRLYQLAYHGRLTDLASCSGLRYNAQPNTNYSILNFAASLSSIDTTKYSKATVYIREPDKCPESAKVEVSIPSAQTVILYDDTQEINTVVSGGANLKNVKTIKTSLSIGNLNLVARKITFEDNGSMKLTFPSIYKVSDINLKGKKTLSLIYSDVKTCTKNLDITDSKKQILNDAVYRLDLPDKKDKEESLTRNDASNNKIEIKIK